MDTIFKKLPTFDAVEKKLDMVLQSDLPNFLQTTHTKHQEVRNGIKSVLLSGSFTVAMVVFLYISWETQSETQTALMTFVTAVWAALLFFNSRRLVTNNRLLIAEMEMALSPILTNVLDCMVMYSHGNEDSARIKDLLKESDFCLENLDSVTSSDTYLVFVDDIEVRMQTVAVDSSAQGAGGRRVRFSGLFISAPLSGRAAGDLYGVVSSEKFTDMHQPFWTRLAERPELNDIVSPESVSCVAVKSVNEEQARTVLNRLETLHACEWQKGADSWIRFSIKDDMMYILVADMSLAVVDDIASVKPAAVRKAALKVLFPMWHSLSLISSVRD